MNTVLPLARRAGTRALTSAAVGALAVALSAAPASAAETFGFIGGHPVSVRVAPGGLAADVTVHLVCPAATGPTAFAALQIDVGPASNVTAGRDYPGQQFSCTGKPQKVTVTVSTTRLGLPLDVTPTLAPHQQYVATVTLRTFPSNDTLQSDRTVTLVETVRVR